MAKRTHFQAVDVVAIRANFSRCRQYRYLLDIPFKDRPDRPYLVVIGQNPSLADAHTADPTIRFLEQYVWQLDANYGGLKVVNLFARVDTRKDQLGELNNPQSDKALHRVIRNHQDILIVVGAQKTKGPYRFRERLLSLKPRLKNKRLWKFDLGTVFPPHPGYTKIFYHNFEVPLAPFDLENY